MRHEALAVVLYGNAAGDADHAAGPMYTLLHYASRVLN